MYCKKCKDNQIKYNDSCFGVDNSSIKSFYEPENNKTTSCYKKFGLYIKEDFNEGISLPNKEEGYYISNKETGLLSKCLNNCSSYDDDSNSQITIEDFKNEIRNDIASYVNSSKVINGSNFLAVVLSSDNIIPEEQLKNGISAVDLGNCTNIMKEYYNIPREENLIIKYGN